MQKATWKILFLISFLHHTMAFSDQSYENTGIASPVIMFLEPALQWDSSEESQQKKPTSEKTEECQYFLTTGLENDDLMDLNPGDDRGYTHGHLTSIVKSCESGEDVIFSLDSRLFTKFSHLEFPSPDSILLAFNFEEENRLTMEYTDRRNFKKPYKTMGLLIGHLSRDKLRFAGQEQKMFHEMLESSRIVEREYVLRKTLFGRREDNPMQRITFSGDVFKYTYVNEDKNSVFVGGKIAFGKSYSLGDLKEICDNQCADYFRTEAGIEFISLKQASHVYVLLEINKTLPQPMDEISLYASVKAQKNESTDGLYRESSAGLKFDVFGLQLHYLLKARELLSEEDRFIEYDSDEDILMFVGTTIPF